MKKLFALLLAILMVVSLAACGASEPAPTEAAKVETPVADTGNEPAKAEKPYEGVTLNIVTANFSATRWMYDHLHEFEEKTGIKVMVEELGLEQINTKTMVAMTAGGADVDLICFQPDKYIKMYTANGWLEPLDRYLTDEEYDVEDINKATYALSNVNGSEYYMPMYGCEHTIVYYNKEMIQTAGIDLLAVRAAHLAPRCSDKLMCQYHVSAGGVDIFTVDHCLYCLGIGLGPDVKAGSDRCRVDKGQQVYVHLSKRITQGVFGQRTRIIGDDVNIAHRQQFAGKMQPLAGVVVAADDKGPDFFGGKVCQKGIKQRHSLLAGDIFVVYIAADQQGVYRVLSRHAADMLQYGFLIVFQALLQQSLADVKVRYM